ncbi:Transcription-repair coupling factor, partial [hydrothermal vent metagenome]
MSKQNIIKTYEKIVQKKQLTHLLSIEKNHFQIANLVGSSLSFIISESFKKTKKPFLLVLNDKEEAAYYLNDLEQLLNEKDVLFYPGSYRRPYQIEETDNANILLRSEVLNRINSRKSPAVIVTYPEALFEQVVTKAELNRNTLKLSLNDKLSLDFVNEVLFEYNFDRVDFVTEPGEFSVRGGIIDVFSFSNDEPYRIEFFGDEVESIRTFDIETQLSTEKLQKISIMPNVENKTLDEKRNSFLKYISSKTVIFIKDIDFLVDKLNLFFKKATIAYTELSSILNHAKPTELFCNGELIKNQLKEFSLVKIANTQQTKNDLESNQKILNQVQHNIIKFNTKPQPSFNKQFDLLIKNLQQN